MSITVGASYDTGKRKTFDDASNKFDKSIDEEPVSTKKYL